MHRLKREEGAQLWHCRQRRPRPWRQPKEPAHLAVEAQAELLQPVDFPAASGKRGGIWAPCQRKGEEPVDRALARQVVAKLAAENEVVCSTFFRTAWARERTLSEEGLVAEFGEQQTR